LNRGAKVTFVNTPFADSTRQAAHLVCLRLGCHQTSHHSKSVASVGSLPRAVFWTSRQAPFDGGKYEADMVKYKWTQGSTG
jgi:hypothetical protein